MARRVSRKSQEQILMHRWWMRALLALAFIGLAYGFASLAIDSGSLLEYAVTIAFAWWAVHHAIRAVRFAFFG
jgi:hypothetical protein